MSRINVSPFEKDTLKINYMNLSQILTASVHSLTTVDKTKLKSPGVELDTPDSLRHAYLLTNDQPPFYIL